MIEALYPLEIERYGMVENSGGPGRQCGAPGIVRQYRMLGDETLVVMRADRQRYLPWALDGGSPGTPSYHVVNPGPQQRVLPQNPMEAIRISRGEVFCHIGAGGAGVGNPLDRDPIKVQDDVEEERITALYAREVYGVVLENNAVNLAATAIERDRLRKRSDAASPAYLRHFLSPLGITRFALEGERELRTNAREPLDQ
jgi:N-methylhydantoinase B